MTVSSPPRSGRRRRGVALLTTLAVLVLLLLLTSGAAHLALGDARRGNDGRVIAVSSSAAEAGAWSVLRDRVGFDFDSMNVGDTLPSATVVAGDGGALVRGRRTSLVTWWVTSLGFAPDTVAVGHARRAIHLVLRQAIPELSGTAALTVRDSATVLGRGRVVGSDTATGAWAVGCTVAGAVAGVAAADTTTVSHGTVTGAPPLRQDPVAALASTYLAFGPDTWSDLTARAAHVWPGGAVVSPAPSLTSGACRVSDPANWGEPAGTGPCARHAPLVWVHGDLELRGGRGQGVLLVDGDLRVSGGAEYHGVVVARDDVIAGPGGGQLLGAVFAADSARGPGDHSRIGDDLVIRRSSCTVDGVLRRIARLVPVGRRAWGDMH